MWNTLKTLFTDRLDLLFFGVFLWILPFSWRKVLSVSALPQGASFNEYMDISFFVADIFLLLTFTIYIINNKIYLLSILTNIYRNSQSMFHVEQWRLYTPLLLFLFLALISYFWSLQRFLNLYTSLRVIEMAVLFSYIYLNFVPRGTSKDKTESSTWNILKYILSIIVLGGLFQAFIGIAQFALGESLGLRFLGESILRTDLPGVAKIVFEESVYLRSYGTFLHPNIYAGYLFLSFFSLIYLFRSQMFHVEHRIYVFLLFTLGLGIVLSFSKSALLAFILGSIILLFSKQRKLFHVEQCIVLVTIFFSLILIFFFQNGKYLSQSIEERISLLPFTVEMIKNSPIIGNGLGQFVYNMAQNGSFQVWQLQPIHNIPLLILFETGFVGLTLLIVFLWTFYRYVPRGTLSGTYALVLGIGFLSIGLADHYLWDIEAGQFMLWTALGLIASSRYLTK